MKTSKILWGLLTIGAAVVLLLLAFGLGGEYNAALIIGSALLLGIAIASVVHLNFVTFCIPLGLIAYLWRDQLGFPDLNGWLVAGAAALLGIGLTIIFHKRGSSHSLCHVVVNGKEIEDGDDHDWKTEEVINDNENVSINSSWGENIKYVHADNLKKAKIKSNFASTKVYFDECNASPEGLEINVNASFCEVVLNVPAGWQIDNQISTFAAEVHDHVLKSAAPTAKVLLSGNVSFAELKIIRV